MLTKSLLLTDQWDITLDDTGSMAITANPYAVAQDVACACSTFLGEAWYDTSLGIPYYERILGHWPGTQLINTKMTTEAKSSRMSRQHSAPLRWQNRPPCIRRDDHNRHEQRSDHNPILR